VKESLVMSWVSGLIIKTETTFIQHMDTAHLLAECVPGYLLKILIDGIRGVELEERLDNLEKAIEGDKSHEG